MVEKRHFAKSLTFIILIGLCIVVFGIFIAIGVFSRVNIYIKHSMMQEAGDKLNIAFLLVKQHYESYINGFFDEPYAQNMTKVHLENLFYGPEHLDYFWVLNKEGVLIAHPYLKDYLNRSYKEIDDPVYQNAIERILQAAKENESFVEYEFYKYGSSQLEQKTSAIRVFEPWGWIIGTGYYRTTLLTNIKSIQQNFLIATIVFFALIFVIYFAFLVQYKKSNDKIARIIKEIRTERDRLRVLIESMPQPVALFDQDQKLIDHNKAYSEIQNFGLPKMNNQCYANLQCPYEINLKTPSGTKWYTVHCFTVGKENYSEGFIQIFTDITEQKLQILFWQDKANQDPLTKIANRNILEELIDNFPSLGQNFSVIMIDIDGFKQVNDLYGHLVGDRVLAHFAEVIKNSVRKDTLVIRYGGDEFLIILPNAQKGVAKNFIDRIRRELQEPLKIDDIKITIGFCAGIATFSEDGEKLRDLIERADKALYMAKSSGVNQTSF